MAKPDGALTAAQHEILDVFWDQKAEGATVAEVWQVVSETRNVARTTVLNQIDRLEKRGWLIRQQDGVGVRYFPAVSRDEASQSLVSGFVDDFFGGSASQLVMSLLGSNKLSHDDIRQLRSMLNKQTKGGK